MTLNVDNTNLEDDYFKHSAIIDKVQPSTLGNDSADTPQNFPLMDIGTSQHSRKMDHPKYAKKFDSDIGNITRTVHT